MQDFKDTVPQKQMMIFIVARHRGVWNLKKLKHTFNPCSESHMWPFKKGKWTPRCLRHRELDSTVSKTAGSFILENFSTYSYCKSSPVSILCELKFIYCNYLLCRIHLLDFLQECQEIEKRERDTKRETRRYYCTVVLVISA